MPFPSRKSGSLHVYALTFSTLRSKYLPVNLIFFTSPYQPSPQLSSSFPFLGSTSHPENHSLLSSIERLSSVAWKSQCLMPAQASSPMSLAWSSEKLAGKEWTNGLKDGTSFSTGRRAALRSGMKKGPFLPTLKSHLTKLGLHLGSLLLHIPKKKALNL